jgi:uncharacterized protein HemX
MSEIDQTVSEALERSEHPPESHLNAVIAVLVAIIATIMALCNIKDGNIVQAMAQVQARGVDAWSYYQAKSTKQHLAENMVDLLTAQQGLGLISRRQPRADLQRKINAYREEVRKYETEKEAILRQARSFQKEYDRLNMHDDQFDMADASFSVSIAILGISALTKKRWLVGFAVLLATFGTVLGLAGFLGWSLHPDALAKFLS